VATAHVAQLVYMKSWSHSSSSLPHPTFINPPNNQHYWSQSHIFKHTQTFRSNIKSTSVIMSGSGCGCATSGSCGCGENCTCEGCPVRCVPLCLRFFECLCGDSTNNRHASLFLNARKAQRRPGILYSTHDSVLVWHVSPHYGHNKCTLVCV
jgi:hypothetical protein